MAKYRRDQFSEITLLKKEWLLAMAGEEAATADEHSDAFKGFAVLLTGHSIAEEGVLYGGLPKAHDDEAPGPAAYKPHPSR